MKPETKDWLGKADEHMGAAGVLIGDGFYAQCVFFCEQAIETLLKAIWVEQAEVGVPPKVHDLVSLAKELALPLDDGQLEFLRRLQEQYMPTRYADIPVQYTQETAALFYENSQGLFSWLRQRLS